MARVTGKNGAVSLPSGTAADFSSWRISATHIVDDDTSYTDTIPGASHSGSGSVTYSFDASGFLFSNVASSNPGIGTVSSTVALADVDGASSTFTAHTGCTFAGTTIFTSAEINHSKRSGAIPVSYSGVFDGAVTETWATT